MATEYAISAANGQLLAAGLAEDIAMDRAYSLADWIGSAVYVYGPDDTEETAVRVEPIAESTEID
jgi:hypothetical protein